MYGRHLLRAIFGRKTACQKYFFQILPPKSAQILNLKNPDLDLIRRIHPECGFYGFMVCFWICPKTRNSVFGFGTDPHLACEQALLFGRVKRVSRGSLRLPK